MLLGRSFRPLPRGSVGRSSSGAVSPGIPGSDQRDGIRTTKEDPRADCLSGPSRAWDVGPGNTPGHDGAPVLPDFECPA